MNPRQALIQNVAKRMIGRRRNRIKGGGIDRNLGKGLRRAPAPLAPDSINVPSGVVGFDPLTTKRTKQRRGGVGY